MELKFLVFRLRKERMTFRDKVCELRAGEGLTFDVRR